MSHDCETVVVGQTGRVNQPGTPLRVTSWNVHGSARPNREGLVRAITTLQADVVALQEIRVGQAHRLANRLGWHVLWAHKHFPLGPLVWWRAEGLAVISRCRLSPLPTWELSNGVGRSSYRRRIEIGRAHV